MGYGFMVWAVDTDKLKQVVGSKDEKLRRMIGGRFKRDIASLDELFEGREPAPYEALRQIIDGTIPKGASGGPYYYAFKLLVEHFGAFLDNGAVYPWSSPDFSKVDKALADMGVPFKMSSLHGLSLPVKLPYPDDFPMSGWVDNAAVQVANEAFGKAKAVQTDSETADIVQCIRGWFSAAAAKKRGLVSFYH